MPLHLQREVASARQGAAFLLVEQEGLKARGMSCSLAGCWSPPALPLLSLPSILSSPSSSSSSPPPSLSSSLLGTSPWLHTRRQHLHPKASGMQQGPLPKSHVPLSSICSTSLFPPHTPAQTHPGVLHWGETPPYSLHRLCDDGAGVGGKRLGKQFKKIIIIKK